MAALIHGTTKNIFPITPSEFPGLEVWYDAADASTVTLTAGKVSQWNDKSGKNRHVSQSNATLQPTYSANAIVCNGLSWLSNTNTGGELTGMFSTAGTVFIVFNSTVVSTYRRILRVWESTVNGSILIDNSQVGVNYQNGGGYYYTGAPPTNTITLYHGTYNTTSTSQYSINGAALTAIPTPYGGTATSTLLSVCNEYTGGSSGLTGNLYEILIFSTYLDAQQKQVIDGYLMWKWGIQSKLLTTHSYYVRRPFARQFTPTDIPFLNLWLDATDTRTLTLSTGRVTRWRDKCTRDPDSTNIGTYAGPYTEPVGSTVYRGPLYDSNAQTLYFDNGNSSTKTTNNAGLRIIKTTDAVTTSTRTVPSGSVNMCVYVVCNNSRPITDIQNDVIQFRNSSPGTVEYHCDLGMGSSTPYGGPFMYSSGAAAGVTLSTNTSWSTSGTFTLFGFFFTGNSVTVRVNGSNAITTTGATIMTTPSNFGLFTIGAHIDSRQFTGYIKEIVMLDYTDTTVNAGLINTFMLEGYLAWKHTLQSYLPSSHPYKNYNPSIFNPGLNQSSIRNFIASYNLFGEQFYRLSHYTAAANQAYIRGLATDSYNNIIATGRYVSSTFTAYNQDATTFATLANNSASECGYIVKYNSKGYGSWRARLVSSSTSVGGSFGPCTVDKTDDSIYVGANTAINASGLTYTFSNAAQASGGTRVNATTTDSMVVLAKYTSDGNVSWLARAVAGGASAVSNAVTSITVDTTNSNVIICGLLRSNILTFYGANNTTTASLSTTYSGGFIMPYASDGTLQTTLRTRILASATPGLISLAGDPYASGSVLFLTGTASAGTYTFYDAPGTTSTISLSFATQFGFVTTYDNSTGACMGAAKMGSTAGTTNCNGTTGFYTVGHFAAPSIDFYNGSDTVSRSLTLSSATQDAFLVSYQSFVPQWCVSTSGVASSITTFRNVKLDVGILYVTGFTTSTSLTFNSVSTLNTSIRSTITFSKRSSGTTQTAFIAAYSTRGKFLFVREIGSIGGTDSVQVVEGPIAIDSLRRVHAGYYTTTTGTLLMLN